MTAALSRAEHMTAKIYTFYRAITFLKVRGQLDSCHQFYDFFSTKTQRGCPYIMQYSGIKRECDLQAFSFGQQSLGLSWFISYNPFHPLSHSRLHTLGPFM